MNGVFEITIDGDLFKAKVSLEAAEAPEELMAMLPVETEKTETELDE
mgnify:FL=1